MRNKYVWLFLLLSLLNLLVMHYTIISTCDAENELHPEDFVDNLAFVTIEVILLFSGLTVLCWGRVRRSLLLTWVITVLWAFCNLVYSRFSSSISPCRPSPRATVCSTPLSSAASSTVSVGAISISWSVWGWPSASTDVPHRSG